MKNDEYLRAISLKKNKIGDEGIKEMLSVCSANRKLLQVDLSANGGSFERQQEWKKDFQKELLINVSKGIKNYQKKKTRINFEWINPDQFDIVIITPIEEQNKAEVKKANKRAAFIQVASQLA